MKKKKNIKSLILFILITILLAVELFQEIKEIDWNKIETKQVITNNQSNDFISETLKSFGIEWDGSKEKYLDLDELNRATGAYAIVSKDTLPTEKRGSIQKVYPTGWKNKKYDIIPGKYLYNRCHLIAHSLTGENDNWKNLITCTRQANEAMIPYEKEVASKAKEGSEVLYIVKPIFEGENKLSSYIKMGAWERKIDNNQEYYIKLFTVTIPNEQEGIVLDYKTGSSRKKTENK